SQLLPFHQIALAAVSAAGPLQLRASGQLRRGRHEPLRPSFRGSIFNGDVPAFDVAEVAQPLPKVVPDGSVIDDAATRHFRLRCGRRARRRERPSRSCATEQRYELAPPHSITSSARASSVGGTSRPSALAVLRLMTSSYLVGACTGRSAGFSPLRMRST